VDYIVQHTVGKLCDGKTPKQIARLRILDPACGSGSFLIGAYDALLRYHRDWYVKDGAEQHRKELFQAVSGEWRLTTQEKKRILLNNIYGVDIDPQAVEVTKLSLLLKVLEGESDETLKRQLSFVRERALPDLGRNIKCGNSLIGPDYFTGQLLPDEEAMRRINPFDWMAEFPEVMEAGGFDGVIGNPPYVRSQTLGAEQREYYNRNYQTATATYDIYVLFVERAIALMDDHGRAGFILPNKFFTTDYGEGLRTILGRHNLVERLVDFEDAQVFAKAGTYTALLFLSRAQKENVEYARLGAVYRDAGSIGLASVLSSSSLSFSPLRITHDGSRWTLATGRSGQLLGRLQRAFPSFERLHIHIFQGLKTSADKIYTFKVEKAGDRLFKVTNGFGQRVELERDILKPMVKGEHAQRYFIDRSQNLSILYPYSVDADGRATLIGENELSKRFPRAWRYLNEHRKVLGARDAGKWGKRQDWYAYARSQNIATFAGLKFLVPYMTMRLRVAPDERGELFFVNITTGGYGLRIEAGKHHNLYLLALLNSALLNHCIRQMTNQFRGGYFAVNKQGLERLPFRPINFSGPADKAKHDQVVSLVQRMLDLHQRLAAAKAPADKERLQRQIDATDREIDQLVYDLYGLTEEEIAIVEGSEVASGPATCENAPHEDSNPSTARPQKAGRQTASVATAPQYAGKSGGGAPEGAAGARGPIHGVREGTGEHGPPPDSPEDPESGEALASTRYFDTAEGRLSYTEVAERLAVPLVAILDDLLQTPPAQIVVTSEWLCVRHRRLAGHLFPEWAGRFRDVNVRVGAHTPPPSYDVAVFMRQFCDDLAERLHHPVEATTGGLVELLAWADWRFQWIRPFKDFNGRIGRVLLAAMLYKLSLPHVETAPMDPVSRQQYLGTLHAADRGDLGPLMNAWMRRLLDLL